MKNRFLADFNNTWINDTEGIELLSFRFLIRKQEEIIGIIVSLLGFTIGIGFYYGE